MSYVQDQDDSVVHHRRSAFHYCLLRELDAPGDVLVAGLTVWSPRPAHPPDTRLIPTYSREVVFWLIAVRSLLKMKVVSSPQRLTAFSRVVQQNWKTNQRTRTTMLLLVNAFPVARCNSAKALFKSVCALSSLPRATVNAV